MNRMDNTQENLHALAHKVAHWSKEAASLSAGLREEALLLELSSQAEKLAVAEARRTELHRQEHVSRLSRENTMLRDELRDMVRLCTLLLERTPRSGADDSGASAGGAAGAGAADGRRRDMQWPATAAVVAPSAQGYDDMAGGLSVYFDHSGYASQAADAAVKQRVAAARRRAGATPSAYAPPSAFRAAGSAASQLPYTSLSYMPAGSGTAAASSRTALYDASDEYDGYGEQGEDEAAQGQPTPQEYADEAAGEEHAGGEDAWAYADEGAAQEAADADGQEEYATPDMADFRDGLPASAAEVEEEAGVDGEVLEQRHHQVGAALAALDEALAELTLNVAPRGDDSGGNGAGAGSADGDDGSPRDVADGEDMAGLFGGEEGDDVDDGAALAAEAGESGGMDSTAGHGTFAGFPQRQQDGQEFEQPTPAVPEPWRRPAVQRDAAVWTGRGGRGGPPDSDVYDAAAGAEAVDQAAVRLAAQPAAGTPKGSPAKLLGGGGGSAPATPVYQGIARGMSDAAPDTIRRAAAAPQSAPPSTAAIAAASAAAASAVASAASASSAAYAASQAAVGLDSLLLAEVEKLKQVNKALAATLQSYNRVSDRLGAAAVGAAAADPSGPTTPPAARSLFSPASYGIYPSADQPSLSSAAAPAPKTPQRAAPAVSSYASAYAAARPRTAADVTVTASPARGLAQPRPATAGAAAQAGSVLGDVRRLDSALDLDLYGIRRELAELKREMAVDRLAASAASAAGGSPGFTASVARAAGLSASPSAAGGSRMLPVSPPPAVVAPPTSLRYDALEVGRLRDEVSELRRQLQLDRRWYFNSLDAVVAERSAMFEDLQRRLDRLAAWA